MTMKHFAKANIMQSDTCFDKLGSSGTNFQNHQVHKHHAQAHLVTYKMSVSEHKISKNQKPKPKTSCTNFESQSTKVLGQTESSQLKPKIPKSQNQKPKLRLERTSDTALKVSAQITKQHNQSLTYQSHTDQSRSDQAHTHAKPSTHSTHSVSTAAILQYQRCSQTGTSITTTIYHTQTQHQKNRYHHRRQIHATDQSPVHAHWSLLVGASHNITTTHTTHAILSSRRSTR